MKSGMSELKLERETTIVWNEAEAEAMIWSASPAFHRKMAKLGIEPYQEVGRGGRERSYWYRIPSVWVRVRAPKRRVLTDEQRQKMAEVARRSFSKKVKV
jgi:hypothetical protein